MLRPLWTVFFGVFVLLALLPMSAALGAGGYEIESVRRVGRIDRGDGEGGAAFIAYSIPYRNLYIANRARSSLDIVDLTRPTRPVLVDSVDLSGFGGRVCSVAVSRYVAVTLEREPDHEPGRVLLFDHLGGFLAEFQVGVQPKMAVFTPDGRILLTADEGAPSEDDAGDPEGSVSIVDLSRGVDDADVTTVDFHAFDGMREDLIGRGVRVSGRNGSVSQNLEPEYIAVSADSRRAWVTLQENNAIAEVDILSRRVTGIYPLGASDFREEVDGLDPRDGGGSTGPRSESVRSFYRPYGVFAFLRKGSQYLITANGGTRSFTVWSVGEDGVLEPVYESGCLTEQTRAAVERGTFDGGGNDAEVVDGKKDAPMCDPEAVTLGVILGRLFAFVGLGGEPGGVMMYEITDLDNPRFVRWISSNDGSGGEGDASPEVVCFVHASESPTAYPLLLVSHERTGSVAIYEIEPASRTESGAEGDIEELTGLLEFGQAGRPQSSGENPAE